jgi:hypothetical protein
MVKGLVIGFLLAVVILAGAVFGYFASGMAPVATADAPMPFEKKLANMAMDAHIEKQHAVQSPVAADEAYTKTTARPVTDCRASPPPTMPRQCFRSRLNCFGGTV